MKLRREKRPTDRTEDGVGDAERDMAESLTKRELRHKRNPRYRIFPKSGTLKVRLNQRTNVREAPISRDAGRRVPREKSLRQNRAKSIRKPSRDERAGSKTRSANRHSMPWKPGGSDRVEARMLRKCDSPWNRPPFSRQPREWISEDGDRPNRNNNRRNSGLRNASASRCRKRLSNGGDSLPSSDTGRGDRRAADSRSGRQKKAYAHAKPAVEHAITREPARDVRQPVRSGGGAA